MATGPPLPQEFIVAGGRALGLTTHRMSVLPFLRPFHGVRTLQALDPASEPALDDHLRRIRAYELIRSPAAFFSHISAAVLWGVPLPPGLVEGPVEACVLTPHRNPRGRGVRGHTLAPHLGSVLAAAREVVPAASPATTWAMLGARLRPYDLVAAADALVRLPQHRSDPPPLATLAQLESAVTAGRRVGIGALRLALPRVRVGSSSRPETWVRLTLVDAGLPEPVLAHEVSSRDGDLIGRADMAYPVRRVAIEYEGEQHLTDPVQWAIDIERYERMADAGWRVLRVTKSDVFTHPRALIERVRAALARAR